MLVVKNLHANKRDIKDTGSIPGRGRSPGGGHGSPLQYSCLENTMDRGACWATVQSVTKSWTWQQRLSTHTLKVKTRMVAWVQNECKRVGCLRSWFQGWPGAQLTAARSSAHCCCSESSRMVQSFWNICHMLLGWEKIKFKNSKYGFYWMCIAFLPLENQKTEINTRSWWQFVAIKRNWLLIHLVA